MNFCITILPSELHFTAEPGQTILEAAATAGFTLPHACRSGSCGACEGKILAGQIDYGEYQESLITEDDKELGLALFCTARPLSDLTIEVKGVNAVKNPPVTNLVCHVERLEKLCHDVMGIWLRLPDDERLSALPGQYIDILLENNRRRSFSLANPPEEGALLELHVRRIPGGFFSEHVFNRLNVNDALRIKGPFGEFFLRSSEKPAIFLAGGTGFAPVKSVLSQALRQGDKRRILLYWGARQMRDLYMAELPSRWQQEHETFTFIPVLSEPAGDEGWEGRRGLVHQAVLDDVPDLSGYQVYACGAPGMIEVAKRDFIARGLHAEEFFADAFSFQPAAAT